VFTSWAQEQLPGSLGSDLKLFLWPLAEEMQEVAGPPGNGPTLWVAKNKLGHHLCRLTPRALHGCDFPWWPRNSPLLMWSYHHGLPCGWALVTRLCNCPEGSVRPQAGRWGWSHECGRPATVLSAESPVQEAGSDNADTGEAERLWQLGGQVKPVQPGVRRPFLRR
jgi:hypothetical protein